MLIYENESLLMAMVKPLVARLVDGELIIRRAPFRWMFRDRTGAWSVISNAYESFDLDDVCDRKRWEVVHDFYHFAVVRNATPNPEEE